jgi:glycosyltransferase involved in cell wall biosynthesis
MRIMGGSPRFLVVAWARFQPRTSALGPALGGESRHIYARWPGRQLVLLPLRYLVNAVDMWRTLRRYRPTVLVVVTPPVVAPAVGWLWSVLHGNALVIDCHTAGFHWRKWRWTVPIHRLLFHRAAAVLVHSPQDESMVRGWGFNGLLLPDDLPDAGEAAAVTSRSAARRIVVAGSFDKDEPITAAISAASLIPDAEVRFTGDIRRLPAGLVGNAPPNVVFCGYLPYAQFLGELLAADAVAVFSTDPTAVNRAAFEAIGLGRPLVLSDVPGLRGRFQEAALLCSNEPAAMASTLRRALRAQQELAGRSQVLRQQLQRQRDNALAQLKSVVEPSIRQPGVVGSARGIR